MLNIEKVGWGEEESHLDSWISLVKINLEPRTLFDDAEGEILSSEKIHFFDWPDCERMTKVLSPVNAMAWAQKVILCKMFSSVQINIFTEEVVFRLNINCKTIFILSSKTF